MELREFREYFIEQLSGIYPKSEATAIFHILSEKYLQLSRLEIALDPQKVISQRELDLLEKTLERLVLHEPIQYITGETEFFGLPFRVNSQVLIPRPETEELVGWILEDLVERKGEKLKILDIGTGSGCIAISLAKHLPAADVFGMDISGSALQIARENGILNGVNVHFIEGDVLACESLEETYDVIVSNPPYVRESEKGQMRPNVLAHEPHSALYVPDEFPLVFYDKIASLAAAFLSPRGGLYFEINEYLGEETISLLGEKDFHTRLKKDIFGVDRMIKGTRP